ncbi:MAG: hypothetical protein ABH881_01345 [bacterium]
MSHKIAQLVLTPNKPGSTGEIFIAQPDSDIEALAGKLFILAEIDSGKNASLKIINFLINSAYRNYYQNEKIILREKISTLKVEHIFEAALTKTNKNFADFLEEEKIKIDLSSLNITVGIIYEDELHFSTMGKNKVLLIYKNKGEEKIRNGQKIISGSEYKVSDIAKRSDASEPNGTEDKLFANVISGKIPKKGNFVIANEALPEYIGNKQLINIITTLPPKSATEQIKNILSGINSYVSFFLIIIKNSELETEIPRETNIRKTQESIVHLNQTEETAENLLAPSGIINLKKMSAIKQLWERKRPGTEKILMFKDKIIAQKRGRQIFIKTGEAIRIFFIYLFNIIFYILKTITSKQKLIDIFFNIIYGVKNFFIYVKNLNKKSRILFVVAATLLVLFFINVLVIKNRNKKIAEEQNYSDIITDIKQKQNQIDAKLIYTDDEGALKLAKENEDVIKNLPQDDEEQKENYNKFIESLSRQLEKIRKVERVDDLEKMANLNASTNPQNLIFANDKIYVADSSQKSIYILSVADKSTTVFTDSQTSITKFQSPFLLNDNIYYYNNTNLLEFDTDNQKLNTISLKITNPEDTAVVNIYNSNLYIVDKKENQIYKFGKIAGGFGAGSEWLKENAEISKTTDMTIDGNIYILKNNGELLKFLKGMQVDFKLDTVDPELKNATKLYISSDGDSIYVLEPANNRILVFDKKENENEGKFVLQYSSNKFTDLKDFTVDEKNKIIYILNGTSVYKLEIK